MQPPVVGVGNPFEFDEAADAIDVALHDVSAKTAVGLHGEFEVHACAFMNARERGPFPGLRRKVSAE